MEPFRKCTLMHGETHNTYETARADAVGEREFSVGKTFLPYMTRSLAKESLYELCHKKPGFIHDSGCCGDTTTAPAPAPTGGASPKYPVSTHECLMSVQQAHKHTSTHTCRRTGGFNRFIIHLILLLLLILRP